MVKYLRHFWFGIKRLVLIGSILLLGLAFWLHAGVRSLEFAKPWILNAVNDKDAPYVIGIGDVTIDWSNAVTLGKIRISSVTFAKRDGNVFAQLPEIYATVDPIGFLPFRRLLHKVILHAPHMSVTRNADGNVELGIEDSPSKLPLADLMAFFASSDNQVAAPLKPPTLPFHEIIIDGASITFTDIKTGSKIVSSPVDVDVRRRFGTFEGLATLPFMIDEHPAKVRISLTAQRQQDVHKLTVQMAQMPARLICEFDTCPEKVDATGTLEGTLSVNIAPDMSLHQFHAAILAPKATLTAPQWFADPLKFTQSNIVVDGDWSTQQIGLTQAKLQLEDTTITATGNAQQKPDGWYITGSGSTTRLNVDKIYKYWPLFLAPDSRAWVTSKLKSGYASKGVLTINFTPQDIASTSGVRDEAVDAIADAHEIGFEYLPGFPPVDKLDGVAHFTGKTVRVEGGNGSLMSGTTISHAVLWCPELDNPKNPMEVELSTSSPAADAASILSLKYFPFAASFGLDPKTISGTVDAAMKLKFNAFSGNPADKDPSAIHLDAVTYDIDARLKSVKQDKLYGGYNTHALTGELKANNSGLKFNGTVAVGEAGTNAVTLSQESGKSLYLDVKGMGVDGKQAVTDNDFKLVYTGGDIPVISITGNKLDASASYSNGGAENSLLANFPAMKLDVDLGALYLVANSGFTEVKGSLYCTKERCESAQFTAKSGKDTVKGGITTNAGQRQFLMTAGDAGTMLRNFDITDRMTKGAFDMRGTYNDKLSPPQLNARLLITNFTLQNSQILGRILSIGSLTGLQNALTGSGISFDKFSAGLNSRAGVITVNKGMANGTSLGITVEGTVDTNTTRLNLHGTFAPAYALNSIFGKIPIVGAILGGDQGLIAFNYSVKGTYADPDVGVNPLSGLTPGFLRGIFSGFSDSESKSPDTKAKTKKEPGEVTNNPVSGVVKR